MARLLNALCNVEISKKLKRDETGPQQESSALRAYIQEVREGKRNYDPLKLSASVLNAVRSKVPYAGISVDYDGTEFKYLELGHQQMSR